MEIFLSRLSRFTLSVLICTIGAIQRFRLFMEPVYVQFLRWQCKCLSGDTLRLLDKLGPDPTANLIFLEGPEGRIERVKGILAEYHRQVAGAILFKKQYGEHLEWLRIALLMRKIIGPGALKPPETIREVQSKAGLLLFIAEEQPARKG